VFELNLDAKVIAFKDIKGRSAIVVDDFYRDPDAVRELALSLKYSDDPDLIGGFPGKRGFLDTPEVKEKLYNIYLDLCDNKLWKNEGRHVTALEDGSFRIPLHTKNKPFNVGDFEKNWNVQGFMVNYTNDLLLKKAPLGIIPHQDWWMSEPEESSFQFGSVIYLNSPEECDGGTNLYSHNGEMSIPEDWQPEWMRGVDKDRVSFKYIKDNVNRKNPYTVEFEADMVYNRMVLYQADVLHSLNVDLGMFADYNRINQVFFL
jgi:hypothetical protein|tara:strand:+ start:1288 stop:2067 length:780 start_codon:yes stop_codon:yes gene_type:complete